jgi:hypothetical protein
MRVHEPTAVDARLRLDLTATTLDRSEHVAAPEHRHALGVEELALVDRRRVRRPGEEEVLRTERRAMHPRLLLVPRTDGGDARALRAERAVTPGAGGARCTRKHPLPMARDLLVTCADCDESFRKLLAGRLATRFVMRNCAYITKGQRVVGFLVSHDLVSAPVGFARVLPNIFPVTLNARDLEARA